MYCKNCGQEIDDLAAVCIHCGVAVGNGNKYCHNCGFHIAEGVEFCRSCGVDVRSEAEKKKATAPAPDAKSKLVAGLLGIFVGSLGIHNFYLGYNKRAIIQLLLTLLGCGIGACASSIWALIEGILYLVGHEKYNTDAQGNPLGE